MHFFQLAVKAMGRFLCLVFEDYNKTSTAHDVSIEDFKALMKIDVKDKISNAKDSNILSKCRGICPFLHLIERLLIL